MSDRIPPTTEPDVDAPEPATPALSKPGPRAPRTSAPRSPEPVRIDAASARALVDDFRDTFARLRAELAKVIVGHSDVLEQILIALFAGGHVLIEGVPGTGKTLIVRTLGRGAQPVLQPHPVHRRPDAGRRHRDAHPRGAGRAARVRLRARARSSRTSLLADEINRATPKTQSALLEAMAELQVTVGGHDAPAAAAVLRPRDAEPDRDGGHLPAARSAARSLPFQGRARLPEHRRDAADHRLDDCRGRPAGRGRCSRRARRRARVEELKSLGTGSDGRAASRGVCGGAGARHDPARFQVRARRSLAVCPPTKQINRYVALRFQSARRPGAAARRQGRAPCSTAG